MSLAYVLSMIMLCCVLYRKDHMYICVVLLMNKSERVETCTVFMHILRLLNGINYSLFKNDSNVKTISVVPVKISF